ncbi:MAG: hypothetical protein QME55_06440 [Brevundimonas sp.]|uniref:hypothetical protein n=1 Tax=Brevundimonas sp. TaxID=1871086 RepID=UPI0026379F41|nr:hypothetical protein [Brevundimonas sp.]MDI6624350.1 hypothetical protein [Brevundimonas sp.]MDQ7812419.1 hypothetical protein [Brevundimonas sp.]
MKTLVALTAAALTLAACATSATNTAPPPAGFDASASEFTGWVRVTGEEFQLFGEQRDLRNPGSRACVSGALPRNAQRASGDISGSQVRFTGRTLAWAERNQAQTHDWQGSNISNGCRKDVVILADRVEVLR